LRQKKKKKSCQQEKLETRKFKPIAEEKNNRAEEGWGLSQRGEVIKGGVCPKSTYLRGGRRGGCLPGKKRKPRLQRLPITVAQASKEGRRSSLGASSARTNRYLQDGEDTEKEIRKGKRPRRFEEATCPKSGLDGEKREMRAIGAYMLSDDVGFGAQNCAKVKWLNF